MITVPGDALTVTHWYKENVYDPNDSKIGEVKDVLVNHDGKIEAFIVAVGGLAIGYYALGGGAYGVHALGGNAPNPDAVEFFRRWFGYPD